MADAFLKTQPFMPLPDTLIKPLSQRSVQLSKRGSQRSPEPSDGVLPSEGVHQFHGDRRVEFLDLRIRPLDDQRLRFLPDAVGGERRHRQGLRAFDRVPALAYAGDGGNDLESGGE
jgi:hypothetical protein